MKPIDIMDVPIEKISVSEWNSRVILEEIDESIEELARNIQVNDLQQPIVV